MAGSARSCRVRDGGKFARFACVQELLGTEDLGAHSLTSDMQLQWAAQTEFLCVEGMFEFNHCAIPRTAVGSGGDPSAGAHSSDLAV